MLALNRSKYVAAFAGSICGRPVSDMEIDDEVRAHVFAALSREIEVRDPGRDQWGNWDWDQAANAAQDVTTPSVDQRILEALACDRRESAWPGGKRFALCLTHDIDSVSHRHTPLAAFGEAARRLGGDGTVLSRGEVFARTAAKFAIQRVRLVGGLDPIWHFEDWLRLESEFGFRSTFFAFPSHVVRPHAWDANYRMHDRVVFDGVSMTAGDMLRELADRGWDVGLHGSYHSATDAAILSGERAQIESAIGRPVRSVRQHYLHYDAATTPAVQHAAGLMVDSTQGFNLGVGFRAGTSYPHHCWDWSADAPLPLLEIPQHVMDGALLTRVSAGRSIDDAVGEIVRLMDAVESVGGCLTLSWHPEYLNLPVHWEVYRAALAEAHRRDAWGCSAADLYDWWVARERSYTSVADAVEGR